MSSTLLSATPATGASAAIDPAEAARMSGAANLDSGIALQTANERVKSIHSDLSVGDIDRAYETFADWIRQEVRYAKAERTSNMHELITAMLEMMGWMYDRVPRSMARSAAGVA